MSILLGFLYVIEVVVCILLALVVMVQKPKEGGLGGAIGGGMLEASLGADAGNVLIRTTAILGAIFLVNTLVLAKVVSSIESKKSVMASEPAAVVAPTAPDLGEAPSAPAVEAPSVPAVEAPSVPAVDAPSVPVAPAPTAEVPAVPSVPAAPATK